jgi:hypothetical protein
MLHSAIDENERLIARGYAAASGVEVTADDDAEMACGNFRPVKQMFDLNQTTHLGLLCRAVVVRAGLSLLTHSAARESAFLRSPNFAQGE